MKRLLSLLLTVFLCLLLLAGCGEEDKESSGALSSSEPTAAGEVFSFDTDAYTPPEGRGPAFQNIQTTRVADLARPNRLIYTVDGKAKVFSPEDEKFDSILERNAARDKTALFFSHADENGGYTGERPQFKSIIDPEYYKTGRHLIYRYGEGSYADVVFSLVKEGENRASWVFEDAGNGSYSSPCGAFEAAGELIAYIEG